MLPSWYYVPILTSERQPIHIFFSLGNKPNQLLVSTITLERLLIIPSQSEYWTSTEDSS